MLLKTIHVNTPWHVQMCPAGPHYLNIIFLNLSRVCLESIIKHLESKDSPCNDVEALMSISSYGTLVQTFLGV